MMQVGTIGGSTRASVDRTGRVVCDAHVLDWWVGADDRWHDPATEPSCRQRRLGPGPVAETSIRVPGGDARQRVYAVSAPDAVVVEVENASPAPFVYAAVLRTAGRLEIDGRVLTAGGAPLLSLPRPPLRWATAVGGSTRAAVRGGTASTGPFVAVEGAPVEAAVCFAVSHRTRVRVALASVPCDVARLPSPDAAAHTWEQQLDRAMRTELPEPLQHDVDAARADLLLAPPSPSTFVALESWGFDKEAEQVWAHLGWRDRRRAGGRRAGGDGVLHRVHADLVRETDDAVEILPGFRTDWLGQDLAVHGAPLRTGELSFALRWHGARPTLLDAPAGVVLRAPALDPSWSTTEPAGEALLAEPPARLLSLRARGAPPGAPPPGAPPPGTPPPGAPPHGTPVEDPSSFT